MYERIEHIKLLIESILRSPIDMSSRKMNQVAARDVLVYQLMLDGYSTHASGLIVKKDHSTIVYIRKKMNNFLNSKQETTQKIMWKEFRKMLIKGI